MRSGTRMSLRAKGPPQMRKRPVQQRSNQTVETILAAVERILEREGAERLTTSHVAERAGFSIGTVYQYFPDKHAMLSALADRGQKNAQDAMLVEVRRAAPCSLETVARIIVRNTLRCNSDSADKVCAMIISRFDRREFDHVKERHEMFASFVHGVLTEFAAQEIRPLNQEACFILISALLGPIQCAFLGDPSHAWSNEFEDELVHLFVSYTGLRPQSA